MRTDSAESRISVEIRGSGGLLPIGTVVAFPIPPAVQSAEFDGVTLTVRRRSGRVISIICECVGDARRLPGFEPLVDPRAE